MNNNIRVIISEDDKRVAEIQRRFLGRIDGFELTGIAHSLEDTEDLIEVLKPDLILLDIHFPSGTGLNLLRKLRTHGNNVDIILITAVKEVNALQDALRGGIFDYILKPLIFERLQATLHNYRRQVHNLRSKQTIDQHDVDRILPRKEFMIQGDSGGRLPKGIDRITLNKVRNTLRHTPSPLTADEVGGVIGASRTTARRYLEYLVSINELIAEVSYGSVGRPERKYSHSE